MHQQSHKCFFLDEEFPVIIAFFFRTVLSEVFTMIVFSLFSQEEKKIFKKKKGLLMFGIKFAPKFH